jgi:predicted AlkP superfamily pyrophosphatase or phosphodiesterase
MCNEKLTVSCRSTPFKDHVHWRKKTEQIAEWLGELFSFPSLRGMRDRKLRSDLDLPLDERPRLITAYVPEVDQEGHRTGPSSSQVGKRLEYVDRFAKSVYDTLAERNLDGIVDVIFGARKLLHFVGARCRCELNYVPLGGWLQSRTTA